MNEGFVKVFLSLLFVFNSFAVNKIIFGEDDRMNYSQLNSQQQDLADSVAALVGSWKLEEQDDHFTVKEVKTLGQVKNLCKGEKFEHEQNLSLCSGFLVAPDLVLTAGHCYIEEKFTIEENCKDMHWVFGYHNKNNPNEYRKKLNKKDVYRCKEVIAAGNALDFALVRLERPVTGVKPLDIELDEIDVTNVGSSVFSIGYPNGIPSKFLQSEVKRTYLDSFETHLDTFPGLSGAPVFSSTLNKVIGIHVRGMAPTFVFNKTRSCYMYNKACTEDTKECSNSTEINLMSIAPYIRKFL